MSPASLKKYPEVVFLRKIRIVYISEHRRVRQLAVYGPHRKFRGCDIDHYMMYIFVKQKVPAGFLLVRKSCEIFIHDSGFPEGFDRVSHGSETESGLRRDKPVGRESTLSYRGRDFFDIIFFESVVVLIGRKSEHD